MVESTEEKSSLILGLTVSSKLDWSSDIYFFR